MRDHTAELLEFLEGKAAERRDLAKALGADPSQAYAYYLAPLGNVHKMLSPGQGLRPRNFAHGYIDLSNSGVQSRRTKWVTVIGGDRSTKVPAHDCVNFFLNPLNSTFYAFRRNALLRRDQGELGDRLVCILELPLRRLLSGPQRRWGVSEGNLSRASNVTAYAKSSYEKFAWERIYNPRKAEWDDIRGDLRASELLVNIAHPDQRWIDNLLVSRVLVLPTDARRHEVGKPEWIRVPMVRLFSALADRDDPLSRDREWARCLRVLLANGATAGTIGGFLSQLVQEESAFAPVIASTLAEKTAEQNSLHGGPHVMRVAFWVKYLAEELRWSGYTLTKEEEQVGIYAAFLHDMRRSSGGPRDEEHGASAAEVYRPLLRGVLRTELADRCLKAIEWHSRDSDPDDRDLTWQLLKDADALDRGRYGKPGSRKGCDPRRLRLPILRQGPTSSRLMEAAHYLAKVTDHMRWDGSISYGLAREAIASLTAVAAFTKATPAIDRMVKSIRAGYDQGS